MAQNLAAGSLVSEGFIRNKWVLSSGVWAEDRRVWELSDKETRGSWVVTKRGLVFEVLGRRGG